MPNNLQRWNDIIENLYPELLDKEVFFDIDSRIHFNYGYLLALRKVGAVSAREYTSLIKVHANFDNFDNRHVIEAGSLIDKEKKNE